MRDQLVRCLGQVLRVLVRLSGMGVRRGSVRHLCLLISGEAMWAVLGGRSWLPSAISAICGPCSAPFRDVLGRRAACVVSQVSG